MGPSLQAHVSLYTDAELLGYLYGLAFAGGANLIGAKAAGRPYPSLYRSGVRYRREQKGKEDWQLPSDTLKSGYGDCEDLAAGWRVPELWLAGEPNARIYLKIVSPMLRHIQVRRADGSIEDPSKLLGMGG